MSEGTRSRRVVRVALRVVLLPVLVIGAVRAIRRRHTRVGGPPDGEHGGGTAGDREPRTPLPTTLVDAGAGIPSD